MKKKAIAILTTILISITIFMDTPFAEAHGPNNLISSPYGTCTYEFYYEANNAHNVTIGGITIPQLGPVHVIRYTFSHPYTGTFDLDLNNSSILNNIWNLITSNCYLMSVPEDDTLRFAVNNAEYCEIAIMPAQYYNQLFMSLKNQNLTEVEDVTTAVNDIMTNVSYINGYMQQVQANTQAIRNVLMSMSGYSSDSNDNIATDMDTLINIMTSIDDNISNLVELEKNIQWIEMATIAGWTTDFNTYITSSGYYKNGYYMFNTYGLNYNLYNQDPIIKIQVQLNTIGSNIRNYVKPIMLAYDNSIVDLTPYVIYEYYSRGAVVYYIKFNETFAGYGNVRFGIQLGDLNRYIYSGAGNQLKYIGHDSDDYYRLLNAIVNYGTYGYQSGLLNAINQVENAVRSMSMNVNNLTVNATGITYNVNNTQVNNSITTYNTNINQVYNIENNISADFDIYNQQFTPDFTTSLTSLQDVSTMMNGIITQINGISLFTVPILLTLAGIVLLAILG